MNFNYGKAVPTAEVCAVRQNYQALSDTQINIKRCTMTGDINEIWESSAEMHESKMKSEHTQLIIT